MLAQGDVLLLHGTSGPGVMGPVKADAVAEGPGVSTGGKKRKATTIFAWAAARSSALVDIIACRGRQTPADGKSAGRDS